MNISAFLVHRHVNTFIYSNHLNTELNYPALTYQCAKARCLIEFIKKHPEKNPKPKTRPESKNSINLKTY